MTNIIKALINIIENPISELINHYKGSNRANNMGEALETYIKDSFCNGYNLSEIEKEKAYSNCFSYIGNQNNPPDIILENGDAIEVKKIENFNSAIALNSSYPKNKLYSNDSRITSECRNCENEKWAEKDIIYIIGIVPKESKLKALWIIQGSCYAANPEIYKRIAEKISSGILKIQ